MPNLVKKSHLQDVALNLWSRIQEKLNSYVHKTKENVIVSKTVLFDGYVAGAPLVTVDNPGAVHSMNNDTSYFVCTNLLVSANQKVGQITIGVNSNKQVGEVVTGVNIGAIKRSNSEVLDYVITNGIGIVHENTDGRLNCDKAITVDVDFAWNEDIHLMVGANGALWGPRNNIYGGNAIGGGTLPSVGSTLNLNTGNYVGRVVIYGDVVALRDLGGSGTGGVSREEFNQHVTENNQQHQTFTSNISTITQSVNTANQNITNLSSRVDSANSNITSNTQRIANLEGNVANKGSENTFTARNTFMERSPIVEKYFSIKNISADGSHVLYSGGTYCCNPKGSENTFTARNTFMERSPIVEKYFSIKNISADGSHVLYSGGTYCCNPKEGITTNELISAILVPIHNSMPGDTIQATCFTFNHVLYSGGTYCCNPKEGITTNELISAILVPIHNSMPGDTIQATCFTFNASNYRLTSNISSPSTYTVRDIQYKGEYCIVFEVNRTFNYPVGFGFRVDERFAGSSNISSPSTYTVRDIQYKGEYCIVFEVNRTFNYPVGFGFRVDERFAGSRRIGLLKQDLPNQVSNNAWSSYNPLSIGESVSLNSKFMIPYAITKRASSEVVTRFDLANNTVPTGNYRVGELKMLVYDAGESIEIGGHTWLRCDGQTVSSGDYSEQDLT